MDLISVPVQDDAGLERLVDREVVAGSSVEGDGLFVAHVGLLGSWVATIGAAAPGARTPALADRRSSCLPTHRVSD